MANFRYNPNSEQIEHVAFDSEKPGAVTPVTTKFFVMNGGRLVFEGSQTELAASQDPYVRKFAK